MKRVENGEDRIERIMEMKKQTQTLLAIIVSVILQCTLNASGNTQVEVVGTPATPLKQDEVFDMPASLVHRMQTACSAVRNRNLKTNIDAEELFSLSEKDSGLTNAYVIATRPRGKMIFCDDQLSAKEREEVWPFNVEEFEKSLEKMMARDKDGLYRLKGEYSKYAAPTNDDGLVAVNPTMRWINKQIEEWAIKELDKRFKRMSEKDICKMFKINKLPKGTLVWVLDKLGENGCECFAIEQCDGAWNNRNYIYTLWDGADRVHTVAVFNSFPNRKEGSTIRAYICDVASIHNLAVLEWEHRIFRTSMNPFRIKKQLEISAEKEVPAAKANLKIVRAHIPEVFVTK